MATSKYTSSQLELLTGADLLTGAKREAATMWNQRVKAEKYLHKGYS